MGGGGAALGCGAAMLLLFRAAGWERTFQKEKKTAQEPGSVCMQGAPTGGGGSEPYRSLETLQKENPQYTQRLRRPHEPNPARQK